MGREREMKSMPSVKTQWVSVPIAKAYPEKKVIDGRIFGAGDRVIIFSNMDTNDQNEWNPIIDGLISDKATIFTYDYPEHMDDPYGTLEDVISFVGDSGAKKIILIGASRGGVASIKVAARNVDSNSIVGVVAFSAPIEYEGPVFYSEAELNGIKIPKLLINSENDAGAGDNRKMIEIFREPGELLFYPGAAHGTELFRKESDSIIKKLKMFTESAFMF